MPPKPKLADKIPGLSLWTDPQMPQGPVQDTPGAKPSTLAENPVGWALEKGMDFARGFTGLGDQGPAGKTAINTGALAAAAIPMLGAFKGPGLYSRLTRAMEAAPEAMHPNKALSIARSAASADEINWRKLPQFLSTKGNKVTRAEILQHLNENPINLEHTVQGTALKKAGDPEPVYRPSKYDQYTSPGGSNYRENLTQLKKNPPKIPYPDKPDRLKVLEAAYDAGTVSDAEAREMWRLSAEWRQRHIDARLSNDTLDYYNGHFEEPNILVHTRTKERTLPAEGAGTFLEEVQSDWHQAGKKHGYRDEAKLQQVVNDREKAYQHYRELQDEADAAQRADNAARGSWLRPIDPVTGNYAQVPYGEPTGPLSLSDQAITDAMNAYTDLAEQHANMLAQPPDAPFKEAWPDLALKQHLLEVAEDPEKSWLGWTTGQTQAERFDLGKQVSSLEFHGVPGAAGSELVVHTPAGETYQHGVHTMGQLHDLIGRSVADRLLNSPHPTRPGSFQLDMGGQVMGGEGMHSFYDELLPARMNKILKPFGGRVEMGEIPRPLTPEETANPNLPSTATFKAWIAKLTPDMKERIKREGLPLLTALYALYQKQAGPRTDLGESTMPTAGVK